MFDRQSAVNRAYAGIVSQGVAAVDHRQLCRYRVSDTVRCAIGHLIPDKNYTSSLEGQSAKDEDVRIAVGAMRLDTGFLRDLQRCHDRNRSQDSKEFVRLFDNDIERLCAKYSLQSPVAR